MVRGFKKILSLITITAALVSNAFPWVSNAAGIPEASEVVLIYDNANEEQRTRYNFIYVVDGDNTIYTCSANRCSMKPFREQGTVHLTIYKLPDSFPRVANVVDQKLLVEYRSLAEQQYRLENVPTNLSATADGRPYQEVYLAPDGGALVQSANYDKPEFNVPGVAVEETNSGLAWKIVAGIGGALAIAVLVWILVRIIKARQLPS